MELSAEMTSEVVDREEPKDNKYEAFVAGVLEDFDSRVQAIQTSAEVNMRGRLRQWTIYYCSHSIKLL